MQIATGHAMLEDFYAHSADVSMRKESYSHFSASRSNIPSGDLLSATSVRVHSIRLNNALFNFSFMNSEAI